MSPERTPRQSGSRPPRPSRRRVLRAGAGVAGLGGLHAFAGCLVGGGGDAAGTGLALPSLEVAGSPGGTVHLRREGSLSLLDFFATWCTPCKPQMKELNAVRDRFDTDTLHMVSITNETDERAIRRFWREYDGNWPVAMDEDLQANQRYGINGIPTLVLVDDGGTEHWRHTGLAAADTVISQVEDAGGS